MAPLSNTSIYTSLPANNIRVLDLQPGLQGDPIKVQLRVAPLSTSLKYEAISYCWGGPDAPKLPIQCNGTTVEITESLFGVLKRLRYEKETRTLWADSLAINQINNKEKGEQVLLMKDIYRYASETIIWLGNATSSSDKALQWAAKTTPTTKLYLQRPHIAPFLKLLHKPWFRRVWIIQEVAMSVKASIYCGSARPVPWTTFANACEALTQAQIAVYSGRLIEYPLMIEEARRVVATNSETAAGFDEILNMVTYYRRFEATDPRDKIYALRGLAKGSDILDQIPVDYSISVEELYRKFATVHLRLSKSLQILSACKGISDSLIHCQDPFPSWIADWRTHDDNGSFLTPPDRINGVMRLRDFHATANSEALADISSSGNQLRVTGLIVDRIKVLSMADPAVDHSPRPGEVFTLFDILRTFKGHMETFFEAERICELDAGGTYYPTSEPVADAFGKTLMSGYELDSTDAQVDLFKFHKWYSKIYHFRWFYHMGIYRWEYVAIPVLAFFSGLQTLSAMRKRSANQNFFVSKLLSVSAGRRFLQTETKYIGAAPANAKPGDVVALFRGGKFPFVIRENGDNWELIGDCYIHGLADGRYWDSNVSECRDICLI